MIFCRNCGTKIIDNNRFCTNCGTKLDNIECVNEKENNGLKVVSIVLGIIGIVGSITVVLSPLCLILSLVGLILGIIATKKVNNVSGIVLSSIGLFLSILVSFFIFVWLVIDEIDYENYYDYDLDWNYNEEYNSRDDVLDRKYY